MRHLIKVGVVAPLLLFSAPLTASFAASTQGPTAVVCTAASTQFDLDVCADQAFGKADAKLNADYKKIQDRLKGDATAQKLLIAAQKAWIAYRDSECAFATSLSVQGSIYPMLVAQCRADMTQTRIKTFNVYLTCEEGDLSCPVPRQ